MKLSFNKLIAAGLSTVLAAVGLGIAQHEGEEFTGYLDPVGIETACYGHTKTAQAGKTYTESECLNLLAGDLSENNRQMLSVINVELSASEHSAYLSFHYNVGHGAFKRSTLLKLLNENRRIDACNELLRWVYAKGRKLSGLVNRRNKEHELCLSDLNIMSNNHVELFF